MKYFFASAMLLLLNLLYSAYSLDVAKDYARKVYELKREKERALVIKAQIESYVNYSTVKKYAESVGLSPVDWSRVRVVKTPQE